MHVTQVIPKLHAGGAEIGCLAVAKALIQNGHQASIITSGGQYIDACQKAGIQTILLPVASKNPTTLLSNAKKIATLVTEHTMDLIHVRSRAPAWSVHHALRSSKTPWLATYHGAYGQQNRLKHIYNRVMTKGKAIIAPSHFMHEHILGYYPDCLNKLHTIKRGVDLSTFKKEYSSGNILQFKEQLGLSAETSLILLPGRFTELKGHKLAINAIQILAPTLRQRKIKLLFLGDQSKEQYVQSLQHLIHKSQLDDLVVWMSHTHQMPLAYRASEITLNCSTQPESFGRTIVEAQASMSLIIASKHGGAQENIIHGKTGLLFKPNQADDLAFAIKQALDLKQEDKKNIQQCAQQYACQQACETRMTQETISLYEQLLS